MSNALLKLRLAYNRWYLGQLRSSALSASTSSENIIRAIRQQKDFIKILEERMYENRKAKQ